MNRTPAEPKPPSNAGRVGGNLGSGSPGTCDDAAHSRAATHRKGQASFGDPCYPDALGLHSQCTSTMPGTQRFTSEGIATERIVVSDDLRTIRASLTAFSSTRSVMIVPGLHRLTGTAVGTIDIGKRSPTHSHRERHARVSRRVASRCSKACTVPAPGRRGSPDRDPTRTSGRERECWRRQLYIRWTRSRGKGLQATRQGCCQELAA